MVGPRFIHEVADLPILRRNDFFSGDEDNAVIEAKDVSLGECLHGFHNLEYRCSFVAAIIIITYPQSKLARKFATPSFLPWRTVGLSLVASIAKCDFGGRSALGG